MGSDHVKGSPNGARKCHEFGHRNSRGEPCGANVIRGTTGCARHVGKSRVRAKAEGAVVVELQRWGLGDSTVDPGEVLLRLVTQSAARVELYSSLLAVAYDAARRLEEAAERPDLPRGGVDADRARQDLDRVFNHGAVAALVGHMYAATKDGDIYATGEKLRGLVELEAAERDRCAGFAAKAVAAGLAERQVRLAEQQGALTASVFRAALDDADVPVEVRLRLEAAFVHRMSQVADPLVIEGVAA